MTNYKDYIGKTFKGFKFESKENSGLPYNDIMNDFIGKDLEIQLYNENDNSLKTDSGYWYPADLVIAQLETQTFKPKRGEIVLAWDNNEENAKERIFLTQIEGASNPYICVDKYSEQSFINGNKFSVCPWKNIKPLPISKDTLVWVKNDKSWWFQMYYSHFSDGKHYCFDNQKKSNEMENTTSWQIVTTENPFE